MVAVQVQASNAAILMRFFDFHAVCGGFEADIR